MKTHKTEVQKLKDAVDWLMLEHDLNGRDVADVFRQVFSDVTTDYWLDDEKIAQFKYDFIHQLTATWNFV